MKKMFRAFQGWWKGLRLHIQLAVLSASIIAVTLFVDGYLNATEQSKLALENMREDALALSKNIATTGAYQIVNNDLAALEELLLNFVVFPDVSELTITDEVGTPLGSVRSNAEGEISVIYSTELIELPAFLEGADLAITDIQPHQLRVWQPIKTSTVLGWLQLDYDLSSLTKIRAAIWRENLLTSFIAIIVDVTILLLILRLPTLALRKAEEFALNLHKMDGKLLDTVPSSREVNALTSALNRTAQILYRQNGTIMQTNRDLANSAEQLTAARDNLEQEVQLRTNELADTVEKLRREAHERERISAELERKNTELERFTYTVSHDLKSPLVTIQGFVGLMRRDIADQREDLIKTDLDNISKAAVTMTQLLEDLLELSRAGQIIGELSEYSLSDIVRHTVHSLSGEIDKRGVELEIGDMPLVRADEIRLQEVFQNLIENAIKYMGEQKAPRIRIGAEMNGNMVHCFVEDNGIGIEPRFQEKIFGLFQRLSNDSDGTGIGLALVKRIVDVHGGKVWVESEGSGKGTTFWFSLLCSSKHKA